MNKIYGFNGKKYRLRELDLDMMHRVSPLLIKYRELNYKYTSNIDTSKLDSAENDVMQLKAAIKDTDNSDTKLTDKLKQKLTEAESVLNSPELASLKQFIADTQALVLLEILTDSSFMAGILSSILLGEGGNTEITTTELKSKDSIQFIKEVIADFFLLTGLDSKV